MKRYAYTGIFIFQKLPNGVNIIQLVLDTIINFPSCKDKGKRVLFKVFFVHFIFIWLKFQFLICLMCTNLCSKKKIFLIKNVYFINVFWLVNFEI